MFPSIHYAYYRPGRCSGDPLLSPAVLVDIGSFIHTERTRLAKSACLCARRRDWQAMTNLLLKVLIDSELNWKTDRGSPSDDSHASAANTEAATESVQPRSHSAKSISLYSNWSHIVQKLNWHGLKDLKYWTYETAAPCVSKLEQLWMM